MHRGPRPGAGTSAQAPKLVVTADSAAEDRGLEVPIEEFRSRLRSWYRKHARDLPWRDSDDPYATWLSEIMLQQTRVATVIQRYVEFLRRFPTLRALSKADEEDVLVLWSGLGYYRRARMLHRGAQFVERELEGQLPRTSQALRTLPGIGEYTAAAIASIAFGESIAVVDGNVERVLLRIMGLVEEKSAPARARVTQAAQALVPQAARKKHASNPPGDHNQAMMELGATICLPRAPLCLQCPVFDFCRTRGEHKALPRSKQQSRIVAHLLALRKVGIVTEVLLERRDNSASLMPGMLELPPLPLDAVQGREPVLRVRHAITTTNYYAQIFSEGTLGRALPQSFTAPPKSAAAPLATRPLITSDSEDFNADEDLFVALANDTPADLTPKHRALLDEIPASIADLEWVPTSRLLELPLTGLARKVLQRLGVMQVPQVRMR